MGTGAIGAAVSLCALAAFAAGCRVPALAGDPWADIGRGRAGLAVRQPLVSLYDVSGDFQVGIPSVGFAPLEDASEVEPVYGLVLAASGFVTDDLIVSGGLDFRDYEVNELQPLDPLLVELDAFQAVQVHLDVTYLLAPLAAHPRLRPYLRGGLLFFPRADVEGLALVSLITPGNSDVAFEGRMGSYTEVGLGGGLVYRWSERALLELGLVYEHALDRPDFEIAVDAFGSGDPEDFLISTGEVDPSGWIVHAGFTWLF